MTQLIIIATITAQRGAIDRVKNDLKKIVVKTRMESGCVQYDLHQDLENSACFTIYEIWASHEAWEIHDNSTALQSKMQEMSSYVANVEVSHMSLVDI